MSQHKQHSQQVNDPICPECFRQGRVNPAAFDDEAAVFACDTCQCMWDDQQFQEKWIEVQLELNEKMPVVREVA